ncbi:MAG: HlyD family efflux transporter periplasmic adaptor subunit [Wenzhouxiangellaceae bacterium]
MAAIASTLLIGGWLTYPTLANYTNSDHAVSRSRLRFATVEQGPFVRDISVSGQAVAAVSPTLYSPADGTITLAVRAGDLVTADSTLATIDSPELRNRLLQELATLSRLQVTMERQRIDARQEALRLQQTADLARVRAQAAQRELQRASKSRDQQLISEQDYERKVDELTNARLALEHAEQDAELASERLSFEGRTSQLEVERQQLVVDELQRQSQALEIRSPVSGIVGDLQVEEKAVVTQNQPLITVVDLSALEIELNVPESYAEELSPGMPLTLTYSNQDYPAMLSGISPEVNDNQVIARARFNEAVPQGLKQNQRLTARIVLESKDQAVLVNRGAFIESGNGRVAYLVQGDVAVRRPIQVGAISIAQVEILSGLQPGETIIISNTSSFDSAQQVLLNN